MLLVFSQSTCRLDQAFRVAECLEVRVAANVLLADENVGNRALAGDLLKCILDGAAVICCDGALVKMKETTEMES